MYTARALILLMTVSLSSIEVSANDSPQSFPRIEVRDGRFLDPAGGMRVFRGVNLSGSAKRPLANQERPPLDDRAISFVGRPLSVDEANEHFERIASWGFDLIRLVVPWESIQHEGRGELDERYLDSVVALVDLAAENGLWVVVDPHQDVWSRFTGGDGAPAWTLESVGFDLEGLVEAGGAVVEEMSGEALPPMIWPTNYTKLGSATMFTLFFGGNDFASETLIDGEPVQEVLQGEFLASYSALAYRLRDRANVLGYEVLNEPHPGYIGIEDLNDYMPFPLRNGPTPTPLEAMQAGAGISTEVARWAVGMLGIKEAGKHILNPDGHRAWTSSRGIWESNGVFSQEAGSARLKRPSHFARVDGQEVDFGEDYYKPFVERFISTIREQDPEALIFVVPAFVYGMPRWQDGELENVASGDHFYDQVTLVKKLFVPWLTLDLRTGKPVVGRKKVEALFDELARSLDGRSEALGEHAATFVGETGIPFDLNGGDAFASGDFESQNLALDRSLGALERRGLSYAIWNYTPDNSNRRGDHWNGEDLSIYSSDQEGLHDGIDSGGRALRAAIRPAPSRVAGRIEQFSFNPGNARLHLVVDVHPGTGESVIRLPKFVYPETPGIDISSGSYRLDTAAGRLYWTHGKEERQELVVTPASAPPALESRPGAFLLAACSLLVVVALFWRHRRALAI